MPQFHETSMGKRFFDAQLPNLIRQLTRIADALEEANKPVIIATSDLENKEDK